jgi:hypothetical protein
VAPAPYEPVDEPDEPDEPCVSLGFLSFSAFLFATYYDQFCVFGWSLYLELQIYTITQH